MITTMGKPPAMVPLSQQGTSLRRLAWLPIPLLAAAIIVGRAAGLNESHKSEHLTLALSFTFYTLVSLGTLFLIGRSFLASGMPGLLLLECGVVLWSLAGTVGDAVSHGDANVNVTIFNTVILLAGLCHLAGAILSLRPQRALRATPLWLGAGCVLALGALWLVTRAALANRLPVFFIPRQGGTPVRYCVLISAIAMFVLSAGLLLAGKRAARTPFTSWYSLALLLLAVGLFGVMIQLSLGSVVNWLGRMAQWLGGVYLLLAAVAALRDSHLPLLPPEEKPRPERYRYGVAIAIVLAAAAVRLAFLQMLGMRAVFITFYPAVMLAALYGGVRAGLLATVLSALVADYFWIEPAGQLSIRTPADWLGMAIFVASCTMITWITEAMHRAQRRVAVAEAEAVIAAERVQAEEKINTAHKQLSTMLESITDCYYALDRQWRFTQMNRNAARYFGVEPGDFLGRCYWDVFPQIGGLPFETEYRRAMQDDVAVHFEVPSAVVAGRWVEMHVYPSSGGLFVYFRDITERKRAEAALEEALQRLKALNETLERRVAERTAVAQHRSEQLRALAAQLTQAEQKERQRLALVLHDHLQQLLVGMKFSMTMLRGHVQGDDGSQILHQLGDLVDESIDTSRGLTIELCPPILTKGTMSEVLHWLAGWFASKHGLRVEVQTDEQVHPPTEQVRVLVFQAVRELLFNIVKHAGVDRACVEMTRLEEGWVCVTVTDAGAGFDVAQARPGGGEAGGFGLFSLRERMETIGGQLQIDSAPGKGTRSTLIAPMQLAGALAKGADMAGGAALPVAAGAGMLAEPGGDGGAQAIRVLLADDHQVMRDGLAQLLQAEAGIKVVGKAADGLQVVDMALQLRPDMVVMDVSMPQLDGVEATRRIRCQLPATQVIGLSMFSEANVQDAMLDAGAKAYLAKTAGPEALITAIRACAREPAIEPGV